MKSVLGIPVSSWVPGNVAASVVDFSNAGFFVTSGVSSGLLPFEVLAFFGTELSDMSAISPELLCTSPCPPALLFERTGGGVALDSELPASSPTEIFWQFSGSSSSDQSTDELGIV